MLQWSAWSILLFPSWGRAGSGNFLLILLPWDREEKQLWKVKCISLPKSFTAYLLDFGIVWGAANSCVMSGVQWRQLDLYYVICPYTSFDVSKKLKTVPILLQCSQSFLIHSSWVIILKFGWNKIFQFLDWLTFFCRQKKCGRMRAVPQSLFFPFTKLINFQLSTWSPG